MRILVIGAGGFGRAVAESLTAMAGFESLAFIDDRFVPGLQVDGWPVMGTLADLPRFRSAGETAVVAIGNNGVRADTVGRTQALGFALPAVVHPRAWVSPSAALGDGTIVMPGAIVSAHARLGTGVIVNAGAVVDHDAVLEDFAHLGIGACVEGGARLAARTTAGAGFIVRRP